MKTFLLYLLSEILRFIFSIIGFTYGAFRNRKGIKDKLFDMAQSNDRFIHIMCSELFNDNLIEEEGSIKFGDGRQTVSSILGRNKKINKLKNNKQWWRSGVWWDKFLDKVDPGHTEKAIGWRPSK